jgi:putative phosphoribosyl transferase
MNETRRNQVEHIATQIPVGQIELAADILLPEAAAGLVLFAHGSGSSRHSPPLTAQCASTLSRLCGDSP